jgi:hypothetical protein
MWVNLDLHPSKSKRHILELSTEHTGLGLLYSADKFSIKPIYSQLSTFNTIINTYIWHSQASSSSNAIMNVRNVKQFSDLMSGCTVDSYWGGAQFDYRPGHWLSRLTFRDTPWSMQANAGQNFHWASTAAFQTTSSSFISHSIWRDVAQVLTAL